MDFVDEQGVEAVRDTIKESIRQSKVRPIPIFLLIN